MAPRSRHARWRAHRHSSQLELPIGTTMSSNPDWRSILNFHAILHTICIFKTSKMTRIHLFVMNFNRSAVLVDSGFGLGGSLADHRHAAPKDRKYQRVKNQTVLQLEANSLNQTYGSYRFPLFWDNLDLPCSGLANLLLIWLSRIFFFCLI